MGLDGRARDRLLQIIVSEDTAAERDVETHMAAISPMDTAARPESTRSLPNRDLDARDEHFAVQPSGNLGRIS